MNKTIQSQSIKDETEIRRLTEQWINIWSPQDKLFTGEGFEEIFATGENEILVFDNFQDDVVVLRSLQEYLDTWKPLMESFSYWNVDLEDNWEISVDGDLAVTTFSWVGGGKTKDGQEVKAKQYGTHTWKRLNDQWRLVHEHLTGSEIPEN